MNIVFNCPGCGAILRMKEEYGGRRGRCPHCQGAITVPAIESDAGMDLLPLEGASGDTSAPHGSSSPPAQSLGNFSAGSRFSLPAKQGAESLQGSSGGDSAIGLAPLEERNTKTPPSTAPAPAKTKSVSPGTDSNLGLAPLEDHATSKPAHVAAAKPAAAAKSSAGESAIGLAPLEEVKEKAAPLKPAAAAKPASAAGGEDFGLAPIEGGAAPKANPTTAQGASKSTPAGTATSAAEPRMTCGKCGAKMRIPPNAAGKNVVCPKCKNKMRVPDLASSAPSAAAKSDSDTIALSDTPSSGTDLGGGMLDMLGDDKLAGSGTAAAEDAGAGLSAPKLSAGKSKSGAIFGLPPVALYGGAAAVALVFALGLVYLLGGFSSSVSQVAQSPGMPPAGQTPAAPPTGAPLANSASAAPAQPQPSAPAPTMPTTPPASAPAATRFVLGGFSRRHTQQGASRGSRGRRRRSPRNAAGERAGRAHRARRHRGEYANRCATCGRCKRLEAARAHGALCRFGTACWRNGNATGRRQSASGFFERCTSCAKADCRESYAGHRPGNGSAARPDLC